MLHPVQSTRQLPNGCCCFHLSLLKLNLHHVHNISKPNLSITNQEMQYAHYMKQNKAKHRKEIHTYPQLQATKSTLGRSPSSLSKLGSRFKVFYASASLLLQLLNKWDPCIKIYLLTDPCSVYLIFLCRCSRDITLCIHIFKVGTSQKLHRQDIWVNELGKVLLCCT